MGFYVPTNRDVKFPKACEQCHFYDGLLCCVMDTYVHNPENKHEECPLIEIPDNHGRLIDADALEDMVIKEKHFCAKAAAKHETIVELYKSFGLHDAELMIEAVPTIIPEDEVV